MPNANVRVINLFVDAFAGVDGPACVADPYHVLVPRNGPGAPCRLVWNLITLGGAEPVAELDPDRGIEVEASIDGIGPGPFLDGRRVSPTQWVVEDDNQQEGYQLFRYAVRFTFGGQSGDVRNDPTVINTPDPTADPNPAGPHPAGPHPAGPRRRRGSR